MSHYFKNDETLTNKQIDFEVKIKDIVLNLRTNSGVFSKSKLDLGTKLLLETIELEEKTKIVIDMGCGYGPIGIYIAKKYPDKKVFMYDINERAVDLSKINANLNDVEVIVKQSDLFTEVNFKADVIITNPPIRTGKKNVYRLYDEAYDRLNELGVFYLVVGKKQGAESTFHKINQLFSNCEILEKKKGYTVFKAVK
ncbi:MAG: class I SAM-dependent methyltransferase [Acholeplasmataceae bacterium]|jgi:16S rRNA (guanine1207-N2)-methyltransferase|nr:class I SAM-dependent methyltransferase [Acholeplasmataceae bacterium]